jgi:Zn-dependent peptidase ImmA (M78 family)/DNA-binding XRE family transcriptional regulator
MKGGEVEMQMNDKVDPRVFGERLTKYRKMAGKTQDEVATALGMSRPTYIAIEKGTRPASSGEIVRLGEILSRPVHELLRQDMPVKIEPHLRMAVQTAAKDADEVTRGIQILEGYAEDYLQLERLLKAPLSTHYPPEISLPTRGDLYEFAEDVADRERARLQLGDQPIGNLRKLLESEVGVRVFFGSLPSRVAGLYAFVADLGCCMLINAKHPHERQRASMGHEYGHLLADRHKPGVDYFNHEGRKPANERFVEAFAMAFLMPAAGIRRHFRDVLNATDDFQVGDLVRLASVYDVSVQALTLRLEGMGLVSRGTWNLLSSSKLRVREAKDALAIAPAEDGPEQEYPDRYRLLAVDAYLRGIVGEGGLARYLRCDRIEAREIVAESRKHLEVADDGTPEVFDFPFDQSLFATK